MFKLPEAWVWDFWLVDDGEQYHLFFLYASRALQGPARPAPPGLGRARGVVGPGPLGAGRRRARALGRAGLRRPRDVDRLGRAAPGRSVVHVLHGGLAERRGRERAVHRVCRVVRPSRVGQGAGAGAVRRTRGGTRSTRDGNWHDEAFRDPWVLADPDGDGWHMLITARANHGTSATAGWSGTRGRPTWRTGSCGSRCREPGQGSGSSRCAALRRRRPPGAALQLRGRATCRRRRGPSGMTGGVWIADGRSRRSGPTTSPAPSSSTTVALRRQVHQRPRDRRDEVPGLPQRDREAHFIGEITDPYAVTWDGDRLRLT